MSEELEKALVRARQQLLSGLLSEAQVSRGPVLSILHALGWDTFDVESVVPEYSVGTRRVDYGLRATSSTPDVFLEIKAPGKADADADRQLFEYAFHEGIPFAVLTDGRVWNFYLPSGQGDYQERRLFRLDIVERDLSECCERLERYLGFVRIRQGMARADAVKDYEDRFKKNRTKQLIPKVWKDLLSEPDELICEGLIEAVEAESGERPARGDVEDFLKAQANSAVNASPAKLSAPATRPVSFVQPAPTAYRSALETHGIGYRFGNTEWRSFNTGKQCYLGIIREFVSKYPEFPNRFINAKTKGKRAWIARTREELFPDQPKLQATEVTDIGGGWLVGTNISAYSDMPKRLQAACACVGLVAGRDVEATFL